MRLFYVNNQRLEEVIKTKLVKACDRIEVSEMMYSAEDRKIAKQSRSLRITGVSTHIDDIKIKYRRQGLYFDVLLERSAYHGFNL